MRNIANTPNFGQWNNINECARMIATFKFRHFFDHIKAYAERTFKVICFVLGRNNMFRILPERIGIIGGGYSYNCSLNVKRIVSGQPTKKQNTIRKHII